jgi:hypothetical protein
MNKLESTQLNLCVICDRMGALNGQVEKLLYQNQEMRILLAKLLDVQAVTAVPSSLSCLQQEVQKLYGVLDDDDFVLCPGIHQQRKK